MARLIIEIEDGYEAVEGCKEFIKEVYEWARDGFLYGNVNNSGEIHFEQIYHPGNDIISITEEVD
jgi:hypothetical protein